MNGRRCGRAEAVSDIVATVGSGPARCHAMPRRATGYARGVPLDSGLVLLFVGLQAVVIALLAAQALARGRQLDGIRAVLERAGSARASGDTAAAVLALHERTEGLAWELQQARRDAGYLADLIAVGIVHLDDQLRVDQANEAAHVFLERPAGSLVGRTAMEAFVDHRIEGIVLAARERGSANGEVALRDADGPTMIVRARRSPIRGIWVSLEDVAELRRLQRIRSEFIDNLSHELRTPLSSVALLAEALTRDAELAGDVLPARMRDRIARIEIEVGHLTQMVTELLDLSMIESGSGQLHLDDVDLVEVAAASIERLRLFAERSGVDLQLEAPAGPATVRGDAAALGQVFVNLLHNAVKFSPLGGPVTVRVAPAGTELITSVRDEGLGIAPADLARVFERFYKADRVRSRGGGTGLGLAIVRHTIERHGGRVWVESDEGAGSTFSFALAGAPPVPGPPPSP
jgi:two-component system phosphate regulon sensor histidine kinase PhoR